MWTVVTGIVVLILLIGALTVSVRVVEPQFAFFPTAGEDVTPREFGARFDAVTIDTADGEQLHAWSLPTENPRAYIVYFHGNGGNLSVWAPILVGLARRGYSLLAVDYRGYGRSTGRPSERGLYRDVEAVVGYGAAHRTPGVPLVYWGRSLGTAMAAHAASVKPPDRIVLEAGFPDAATLMRSSPLMALLVRFSSYRFATADMLRGVDAPVLVMHGDRDGVIPFGVGRALFDRLRDPKQFVTIRGGDHNDAVPPDAAAYWSAVDAFIARR
jgi:fermentation-respiration switch protein FrsA (DUF1100 family)